LITYQLLKDFKSSNYLYSSHTLFNRYPIKLFIAIFSIIQIAYSDFKL